jgi:hypothetical protein
MTETKDEAKRYSIYAWRQTVDGRILDHNGSLGYDYDQCVDVPNNWAVHIGIQESYGNAKDLDYSHDCDWIDNGPSNHPMPGDIVIWKGYPADPAYGHVAVALHGCTDLRLRCESQNWPDFSNCHAVIFGTQPPTGDGYQGVAGWFHPRKLGPQGAV